MLLHYWWGFKHKNLEGEHLDVNTTEDNELWIVCLDRLPIHVNALLLATVFGSKPLQGNK